MWEDKNRNCCRHYAIRNRMCIQTPHTFHLYWVCGLIRLYIWKTLLSIWYCQRLHSNTLEPCIRRDIWDLFVSLFPDADLLHLELHHVRWWNRAVPVRTRRSGFSRYCTRRGSSIREFAAHLDTVALCLTLTSRLNCCFWKYKSHFHKPYLYVSRVH